MTTSYRDWVVETSTTTGTGTYSLSGSAPAGTSYFTFRQRYDNGETKVCYWVINNDWTKWEKNRFGTLTNGIPDTLTRNVVESTNGDAAITWTSDDLPLTLYSVPDSDAQEFAISMGLGTTRPSVLKFGIWADQNDVSSGIHTLKLFDGTNDYAIGRVDTVQGKFMPFGVETGMCMPFMGTTAPAGWILHTTTSIGSASSGATRANADTKDLYTLLWNSFSNTVAAVSGGRGANAAADFAANKTLTIPDLTGRAIAGKEASATRLTSGGSGIDGATLGASGGTQTHTLTSAQQASMPLGWTSGGLPVTHAGNGILAAGGSNSGLDASGIAIGGGGAHQNTQPTMVLNYVIKL